MEMTTNNIRFPAVSGQFYPENPNELSQMINVFLQKAKTPKIPGKLKALIIPHAGLIFSGQVAATGFKLAKKYWQNINNIVLLGPSHQTLINHPVQTGFKYWETPFGRVEVKRIAEKQAAINNNAHKKEHSLEIQLLFLQIILKQFTITPILINNYSKDFADHLSNLIDKRTAIIASSDLSHYLSYETAVELDNKTSQAIVNLKPEIISDGQACGLAAIQTLIEIGRQKNWQTQFLEYKNSGDTFGNKSQVVGYGSFGFLV